MYQRILLAYDGANFSTAALQQAAELASLCQAELHLLGIVVTTGSMAIAEALGPQDVWGAELKDLQQMVDATAQGLATQGLKTRASIRHGDPATEIAACAREINADLVILGHTPKGGLIHWLQGSVGANLLDHLPCSLLVATVKPQVVSGDRPGP